MGQTLAYTSEFDYALCRHEKPTDPDDPLSNQNIRDRFYGVNDPVAEKLLSRYKEAPQLETPEDKSITTLYIGNVIDIDEQQLRFVSLLADGLNELPPCSFFFQRSFLSIRRNSFRDCCTKAIVCLRTVHATRINRTSSEGNVQ